MSVAPAAARFRRASAAPSSRVRWRSPVAQDLPHFLGIGAARTGTTWLYHILWSHPQLWLPPVKELHYFDALDDTLPTRSYRYRRHLGRRLRHYGAALLRPGAGGRSATSGLKLDPSWDLTYFLGRYDAAWYQSLFAAAARAGYTTGEITPNYAILSTDMIGRIKTLNSSVKIIYFMRDPIDRSWSSAARYLPEKHHRPLAAIQEQQFRDFFTGPHCSLQSDYMRTIENWRAHFPEQNLFVRCLEDIEEDPAGMAKEVMRFLGVDNSLAHLKLDVRQKRNSSTPRGGVPRAVERILAELYEPRLRIMKDALGGRTVVWHERAVRALDTAQPAAE